MAAALAVATVALVLAVVLMVVRPWEGEAPSPSGFEVDPARVAELEAAEAERAVENLTAAGELAQSAQERLLPVMDGLYEALPPEDEPAEGEPAEQAEPARPTSAELGEWRDVVDDVAADVEALPTGSSEHNIVRNGLLLSTGLLGDTLDVLELAAGTDGGGDAGDDPAQLHDVAGDLRSRAVDAWAVAAVQLDLQYIEADRGHLHAFLPLHSGMAAEGEAEVPHGDH
ncbi:hypothetical protein [Promicromonospora iranensis]|uniref:hypothetical protein n=1 Tax=Promicromonospora iranensis TaxID=1105144 RepID=UPI0023A9C747|nr:hypothetical protein [Promicromonospora iranensis]